MKKLTALIISVYFLLSVFSLPAVSAETEECPDYSGYNISDQNYEVWTNIVRSYLVDDGEYLVRFQGADNKYAAAYYDRKYNLVKHKYIDRELPAFGAFFFDGNNYYILSGQSNPDEKNDVEVFRITKYDKNWKRLGSDGLFGANTVNPFAAGTARMASCGKYIMVHTCHSMYRVGGVSHQANVTIQFDSQNMEITDSLYKISNYGYGYVSHSFDQYVRVDDGKMVTVDLGDAYPRSVALINYPNELSSGSFGNSCDLTNLYEMDGDIGENFTGVSIGGFEVSSSSYIVAINKTEDDAAFNIPFHDVFVLVKPKNSDNVIRKNITNYHFKGLTASTPQLVKINDSRFVLLWERGDTVNYTELDSNGNNGKIYTFDGHLSDCQPIVMNGKLIWYCWEGTNNIFYEINTDNLSERKIVTTNYSHKSTVVKKRGASYFEKGYTGDTVCSNCGKVLKHGKTIAKLKLSVPSVTVKAKKRKFTVKYKKVSNATGFQVKYKQKGKTKTKTFKSKKTVTKTITKLKKGNCTVYVRAVKKSGTKTAYSKWTKAKKIKIK